MDQWVGVFIREGLSCLSQPKPRKFETANREFSLLCPTKMWPVNSNNFSYYVCRKDSLKAAIVNIMSNMKKNHVLRDLIESVTETEGVFIE